MTSLSTRIDLGRDKTRMRDPAHARRQSATATALMKRLYGDEQRFPLQLLADEVGMGKTYVALAVAWSVLEGQSAPDAGSALRATYRNVLIITPNNHGLFAKWQREVEEFPNRCVSPDDQRRSGLTFKPEVIGNVDDIPAVLRRRGRGPQVLVMRSASRTSIRNREIKRRVVLGALFRHWGNAFRNEQRAVVLRGAPAGWPSNPRELQRTDAREAGQVPFTADELLRGIRVVAARPEGEALVTRLLDRCRDIATPYRRGRALLFEKLSVDLVELYKEATFALMDKDLPLVIVDEAHNWKNGRSGYRAFERFIAPHARRALLLTATPFQLRPAEMLQLLKAGDALKAAASRSESAGIVEDYRTFREEAVTSSVNRAADRSRRMAKAWGRLGRQATTQAIEDAWSMPEVEAARARLDAMASEVGALEPLAMERECRRAASAVDPALRDFISQALAVYALNRDVSHELGRLVIRHRRRTDHRLVRVGHELTRNANELARRPDRSVLHAAPGVDVRGEGELPHYLLMRAISELKRCGRTVLGSDLTGCYSTLRHSAAGRLLRDAQGASAAGRVYLDLLQELVGPQHDERHPKVEAVVEQIVRSWRVGEKSLVFCFRTNTARRLQEILAGRIEQELSARRKACLGGEEALRTLRGRLTARNRDLIGVALDRVLWTFALAPNAGWRLRPEDIALRDDEYERLAWCFVRHGVDAKADHTDRVFLHRAHEHVVARRLAARGGAPAAEAALIEAMADPTWLEGAYGLSAGDLTEDENADRSVTSEQGVHFRYRVAVEAPNDESVRRVAADLRERRARAVQSGQSSVFDAYVDSPSLWLGVEPASGHRLVREIHGHLHSITFGEGLRLAERREVMQALRRAVFRESMLLRMLPDRDGRGATRWDELLVDSYFRPLPGQRESVAHRVGVFLEDIRASSGSAMDRTSARGALVDATRQQEAFVALVMGGGDLRTRERRFTGFNTPLLPEIMVCTSVGQEGIDLHRHCRNVIHYDLAWNPAVVEQRTGRVDRIGSKTFRERDLEADDAFLEIALPYLAGTYDERMFAELRIRAQVFEVLTGGDVTADDVTGSDEADEADGRSGEGELPVVTLPPAMVEALRVKLEVYSEEVVKQPRLTA